MPLYHLSNRSLGKLVKVHPHMVRVVKGAILITEIDFGVTEGDRTEEKQRQNIARGVSWTMNSRHLVGSNEVCHAVDLLAYKGRIHSWDEALYHQIADAMKISANQESVEIEWGFDMWGKDGAHFQLPWDTYPKDAPVTY